MLPIDTADLQRLRKGHRCYECVLDFILAYCSIGKYMGFYRGGGVTSFATKIIGDRTEFQTIQIERKVSREAVQFLPHDVLQDMFVNDSRTADIIYSVWPGMATLGGTGVSSMTETLEGFAYSMFTRYYETNLDAMVSAHGKRKQNRWPSVLQFGAVVRDAMSHGGTVHMFSHIPPVTHFGLSYGSADNGRKILHNDLTSADIFLLMLDMDLEF